MDITVTISLVPEEVDDLKAFIAMRVGASVTIEEYIEGLTREQFRQVLDGFRAWKIVEVPYATIKDAFEKVDATTQQQALDLLGLKRAPGGKLTPKEAADITPENIPDVKR